MWVSEEQAILLANSGLAICLCHLASWQPRSAEVAGGPPQLLNGRYDAPEELINSISYFCDPRNAWQKGVVENSIIEWIILIVSKL